VRTSGHAFHEGRQLRFGIVGDPVVGHHLIVPVIATNELEEAQRIRGDRGVDGTGTPRIVDGKGIPATPAMDVVGSPAANEVVVTRIEREENPNPALGRGAQYDQIAIVGCLDLDLGSFPAVIGVLVGPDPNGRVTRASDDRQRQERDRYDRKHQQFFHRASGAEERHLAGMTRAKRMPETKILQIIDLDSETRPGRGWLRTTPAPACPLPTPHVLSGAANTSASR
jgi:hypothetical protein